MLSAVLAPVPPDNKLASANASPPKGAPVLAKEPRVVPPPPESKLASASASPAKVVPAAPAPPNNPPA